MQPLRVEIWSDVACPWCWVGKRQLEAAIAEFPHEVEVVWRAFELDPSAPASIDTSIDYVQRLATKYRTSRDGAQGMIDRMTSVGAEHGLDFRFDRAQPGNTFDAHRLLHWAGKHGLQDALKERLFLAYMHEGKSVAEHEVLVALAEEVGLDPDGAQAVLTSDSHHQDVRGEQALAAEIGVTGVPFFVVGGRYAVPGAQPKDVLGKVLTRAWDETRPEVVEVEAGDGCGPDGCAIPAPAEG
ncbi:MAG: DsbA family oxidoreductase [Deltaproteobacteria bacterium]|nr:DsbA family oxidoreductase [Deltaproteobacteria bacterium]